jgi:hypothetical protein
MAMGMQPMRCEHRRMRSDDRHLVAACPRCDLPMLFDPAELRVKPTQRRLVVRCPCCGTLTPRRRLVVLTAPRRRRAPEPEVHFHRGPQGQATPCFDAGCPRPRQ